MDDFDVYAVARPFGEARTYLEELAMAYRAQAQTHRTHGSTYNLIAARIQSVVLRMYGSAKRTTPDRSLAAPSTTRPRTGALTTPVAAPALPTPTPRAMPLAKPMSSPIRDVGTLLRQEQEVHRVQSSSAAQEVARLKEEVEKLVCSKLAAEESAITWQMAAETAKHRHETWLAEVAAAGQLPEVDMMAKLMEMVKNATSAVSAAGSGSGAGEQGEEA